MSKSIKIVFCLIIAMMLIMTATPVFAAGETAGETETGVDESIAGNIGNPGGIISQIKPANPSETKDIMKVVNNILGFLTWVAIIGGTLIIAVLGVKYMLGSLEEKSEYKKSAIPLVVGILVVMGATTIAKLVFGTFVMK